MGEEEAETMKIVTTRTNHECFFCGKEIPKGTSAKTYLQKIMRVDDSGYYYETHYFHLECPYTQNWKEGQT